MNENFFSRGKSVMKGLKVRRQSYYRPNKLINATQGIENVYTQHTPHLVQTIEALLRGRLRDTSYPYLDEHYYNPNQPQPRPQDIIIFMIGGTTYEEAKSVALLNQQFASGQNVFGLAGQGQQATAASLAHTRIIIGGTGVLNSSMCVRLATCATWI